ncbi:MAG: hypothetical protein A2133_04295 [Actinobacteria bacterium RBG_16_64_13]|nr:MAG: hypothetical protein A2133_04295 [Actinobacteria bacterium RBG_16_64_13]
MSDSGIPNDSSESTGVPPLFHEVQRFRQWIFVVPVLGVTGIVWWQFLQQVVLGNPQGSDPIPNWLAWVLFLVFGLGFPAFGWMVRVVTEVWPGELRVQLVPFRRAHIPVRTIRKAIVREYSPLKEYGGWGMRISRSNGRAYNAYGNRGVQMILDGGALVLVGSQQPEELLAALRSAGADLENTKKSDEA